MEPSPYWMLTVYLCSTFKFNGWGLKFASDKDNLITRRAVEAEVMKGKYVNIGVVSL